MQYIVKFVCINNRFSVSLICFVENVCTYALINRNIYSIYDCLEFFPFFFKYSPSSHPGFMSQTRRKRLRKHARADRPRTMIVPDVYNPSRSLPVKLNKKQLGKIITHLIKMQNEEDSSEDDDNVDEAGNYASG